MHPAIRSGALITAVTVFTGGMGGLYLVGAGLLRSERLQALAALSPWHRTEAFAQELEHLRRADYVDSRQFTRMLRLARLAGDCEARLDILVERAHYDMAEVALAQCPSARPSVAARLSVARGELTAAVERDPTAFDDHPSVLALAGRPREAARATLALGDRISSTDSVGHRDARRSLHRCVAAGLDASTGDEEARARLDALGDSLEHRLPSAPSEANRIEASLHARADLACRLLRAELEAPAARTRRLEGAAAALERYRGWSLWFVDGFEPAITVARAQACTDCTDVGTLPRPRPGRLFSTPALPHLDEGFDSLNSVRGLGRWMDAAVNLGRHEAPTCSALSVRYVLRTRIAQAHAALGLPRPARAWAREAAADFTSAASMPDACGLEEAEHRALQGELEAFLGDRARAHAWLSDTQSDPASFGSCLSALTDEAGDAEVLGTAQRCLPLQVMLLSGAGTDALAVGLRGGLLERPEALARAWSDSLDRSRQTFLLAAPLSDDTLVSLRDVGMYFAWRHYDAGLEDALRRHARRVVLAHRLGLFHTQDELEAIGLEFWHVLTANPSLAIELADQVG